MPEGRGEDVGSLVGGGLVLVEALLFPAGARRALTGNLEGANGAGAIGRPGDGDRGVRAGSVDVDEREVGVGLRRLEDDERGVRGDRPAGRRDERGPAADGARRIGREALGLRLDGAAGAGAAAEEAAAGGSAAGATGKEGGGGSPHAATRKP